jgi:hypothetical protein
MSNLSAIINSDDLVISKQAGGFYSGGFNVSSILKEGNSPVINNFSGGKKDLGDDIFDLFKNLSIPRGIFSMKTEHLNSKYKPQHNRNRQIINDDEYLQDDMVNRLLKLVEPTTNSKEPPDLQQHKKTKKHKNKSKQNKTKKQ